MTNGPINLTEIDQMPVGIRKTLSRHKADLRSNLHLENLLENPELERVIEDPNTVCLLSGVVGVHYTRAMPERIAKEGLVAISGSIRRTEFLEEFGHLFTEQQRQKIVTAWEGYFTPTQSAIRDEKVWFNFTGFALVQGGAGAHDVLWWRVDL